jgi:NADH:ubiquinone oxidoreductase subunit 3 (subunit A)
MSYAVAAVVVFVAMVVVVPAVTLGIALTWARRPTWLARDRAHRRQPDIHAYLMLVVVAVMALALAFVIPFAAAFGSLRHGFTGAEAIFLAVLVLLGLGYAWRRGVLRWQ